jgi:hypothetical protein
MPPDKSLTGMTLDILDQLKTDVTTGYRGTEYRCPRNEMNNKHEAYTIQRGSFLDYNIRKDHGDAWAEIILTAVNHHDELIEALEMLTADNEQRGKAGAGVNWPAIHYARAALAKVKA